MQRINFVTLTRVTVIFAMIMMMMKCSLCGNVKF